MTLCEKCGVELRIGDFPFCPHGHGANNAIGDDIVGGFWQEHFGDKPEYFDSKKAMARRADELGLVPFVRNSGPNDRHVKSWAAMDAYTLAAAETLVGRMK